MSYLVVNLFILLWAFAGWYIAGLGPALALLPYHRRAELFLWAPLIGMSLIILIGLFQITILLTPLTPRINIAILSLFSLLVCLWIRRNDFKSACFFFYRHLLILWLPLLALLFVFAWLFHHDGFHLLTGGSDQLQYTENARHIAEEMHTGSPRDVPVARQDYYVYEGITRILPYLASYRRGSEIILATTAAWTKLSYAEAFPVTIFCALATLVMTLGVIGRRFFHLSLFESLVLQLTFLSSFYFLLLQIQGSLALTLALAPGLGTLALLLRIVRTSSWQWLIMGIILLAGYLAIYTEPALISIFLPTLLLIGYEIHRSFYKGLFAIRRLSLVYLVAFACVPFAIFSLIVNAYDNLHVAYMQYLASQSMATVVQAVTSNYAQQWAPVPVLLGFTSYYDPGATNYQIATFFANAPRIGEIIFFVLCMLGCLGYFKNRNLLSLASIIILTLWAVVSLIMAHDQDALRLTRSLQYAMPFALIGLVLLASNSRSRISGKGYFWIILSSLSRIVLISFISINIFTGAGTIAYISSHDMSNDTILLRFNDRGLPWQSLKDELRPSANQHIPILISGFKETIRPFAIAIIIRSQPHLLGSSISSFWPIYNDFNAIPLDVTSLCLSRSFVLNKQLTEMQLSPLKLGFKQLCTYTTPLMESVSASLPQLNIVSLSDISYQDSDSEAVLKDFLSQQKIIAQKNYVKNERIYNMRLTEKEYLAALEKERRHWVPLENRLLKSSMQAIIPIGNGYPEEWQDDKDVYAPRIERFANIGDVVYRKENAVILSNNMATSLHHDQLGPYRFIIKSGPLIVTHYHNSTYLLTLNYEGNINDLKLKIGDHVITGQSLSNKEQVKIETNVSPEDKTKIHLIIHHPVKLRSISWTPVTS